MFINNTITKTFINILIKDTFTNFGVISTSYLLDSLKFLGFLYATNAGISISSEDLKIPNTKNNLINITNKQNKVLLQNWKNGIISSIEYFHNNIFIWNNITDLLKNQIINYYKQFDPVNNLYIMAFSGARGNISQVRQLIGMRGLMADQDGQIIDLPIKENFREGLTLVDYLISSYGARKGIIDTALKTAESGYLTRRLIYIAQDLLIKEKNCKTKFGYLIKLYNNTNINNLIGKICTSINLPNYPYTVILKTEFILTSQILNYLKKISPLYLLIRSLNTCQTQNAICQYCYGYNLMTNKIISVGETIGIISAHAIGEPGTQLTMRTFHTGGIFTINNLKNILVPFTSKCIINPNIKIKEYRTNFGNKIFKIKNECNLIFKNWKGLEKKILIKNGNYLSINKSSFIVKNKLIIEQNNKSLIPNELLFKLLFNSFSGEFIINQSKLYLSSTLIFNLSDIVAYLASGINLKLPIELNYLFPAELNLNKSFGFLKLISPINGYIIINKNNLLIFNNNIKIKINLLNLISTSTNYKIKLFPIIKNYQYIDKFTLIAYLYVFSIKKTKVFSLKKKKSINSLNLIFISNSNSWNINIDHINNFVQNNFLNTKKINNTLSINNSGIIIKTCGLKYIFQYYLSIFLNKGTILKYLTNSYILKNTNFASIITYNTENNDIIQGLPKIEELIECKNPVYEASLSFNAGIFLKYLIHLKYYELTNNINNFLFIKTLKKYKIIINNYILKNNTLIFNNKLYISTCLYSYLKPILSTQNYFFRLSKEFKYLIQPIYLKSWKKYKIIYNKKKLYNFTNIKNFKKLFKIKKIKKCLNTNFSTFYFNKNLIIIKLDFNKYYFLKKISIINKNNNFKNNILKFKSNHFFDLIDLTTPGLINFYNLLNILYNYHFKRDGFYFGILNSLNKFQLIILNSIQAIYESQNINISSKHVELIIYQMTLKVSIIDPGETPFIYNELINRFLMIEIYKTLKQIQNYTMDRLPIYKPVLQSITDTSKTKDSFICTAGFQGTKNILLKAAIENSSDWIKNLKESLIVGKYIQGGTSYLNSKIYLNKIYSIKK
jgi:hypothetical protein